MRGKPNLSRSGVTRMNGRQHVIHQAFQEWIRAGATKGGGMNRTAREEFAGLRGAANLPGKATLRRILSRHETGRAHRTAGRGGTTSARQRQCRSCEICLRGNPKGCRKVAGGRSPRRPPEKSLVMTAPRRGARPHNRYFSSNSIPAALISSLSSSTKDCLR